MSNVTKDFDSCLETHLQEKKDYLHSHRFAIATGVHVVFGKANELARFKSRENRNKQSSTWAFSLREIDDLDQMIEMGYRVWVITSEDGRWHDWKHIRSRLDLNRAGEDQFVRVSL